jgi:hypothetical protein
MIPKHLHLLFYDFSTIYYAFSKFTKIWIEIQTKYYVGVPDSCKKVPRNLKDFTKWPLAGVGDRGGSGGPFSGAGDRRRRGGIGGKARGRRGQPSSGLVWGQGGWRRARRGGGRLTAVTGGGDGVPMASGRQARVEEHRWGVRKLDAGSVWEEEGRRGRLHGAGPAAGHGDDGGGAPAGLAVGRGSTSFSAASESRSQGRLEPRRVGEGYSTMGWGGGHAGGRCAGVR